MNNINIWVHIEELLENDPVNLELYRVEVERINGALRRSAGDVIGRMAVISVTGSAMGELERENDELRETAALWHEATSTWYESYEQAKTKNLELCSRIENLERVIALMESEK